MAILIGIHHRVARNFATAGLVLLQACSLAPQPMAGVPDRIDYNWHVRPILSENCFKCHGPDAGSRKAGLRLDVESLAVAELPESRGRYAIVPGDSSRSELVARIKSHYADEKMPPSSTGKVLSPAQIETLRRWIDAGAKYKPHWAFIAPEQATPPATKFKARVRSPIDSFVFARLEQEGLKPAREADKETLINRVSVTLTGLPPSLEDVDAFLADEGDDAYERLVDRLLASPSYAEHMAAYWMDLARWSESDGFLDDHHDRLLWPWRDWVLAAFNDNIPFDRFGTWQLAGDLLPDASRDQILATAFLRIGKRTTENGAIDAEYKNEYMVDRTDNALGTAFLGLTVGCARCHDHKYDPISQRDYYSLGAFFNSADEPGVYAPGFSGVQGGPTLPWPDAQTEVRIREAQAELEAAEVRYAAASAIARPRAEAGAAKLLAERKPQLTAAVRNSLANGLAAYYTFDSAQPARLTDLPPARPPRFPPESLLVDFKRPSFPPVTRVETAEQRREREARELAMRVPRTYNAEQLRLMPSTLAGAAPAVVQAPILRPGVRGQALFFDATNKGFAGRGVGWYDRTQPFSFDFWFFAAEAYESVPLLHHSVELSSGLTGYRIAIENGRLYVSLAHSPPANMIALRSTEPFPVGKWTHLTLTYDGASRAAGTRIYLNGKRAAMDVEHDSLTRSMLPWNGVDIFDPFVGLGFGTRFREKAPVGGGIDELRVFGRELQAIEVALLDDHPDLDDRGPEQLRAEVVDWLVARDNEVVAAGEQLSKARELHNTLVTAVPQVLVMRDAPRAIPTHVLNRGVYSEPREAVAPRGLTSVLAWDPKLPENRLGLAQWLFDPRNPLTARVFVNRLWQMHFGRGIVETSEDFGSQGAVPTHPELLDWLALAFVESKWDVKAMHRMIVLSAAFRQDSAMPDELLSRDPANALYARGPRWRMTAEMVRDRALAAGGLLVEHVGGPSVRPYQPPGIWNPLNSFYRYPEPAQVPADDLHRRTLYTFVKRNALHPSLKVFDFKNRTESTARRRSSNTPLQALDLMNDPQYVEAYRSLAESVLSSSTDARARMARLYRIATRTTPSTTVVERLNRYYEEQHALMASDPEKARALLGVGVKPPGDYDPVDLATMTQVAAVAMNSPDAYTVR